MKRKNYISKSYKLKLLDSHSKIQPVLYNYTVNINIYLSTTLKNYCTKLKNSTDIFLHGNIIDIVLEALKLISFFKKYPQQKLD